MTMYAGKVGADGKWDDDKSLGALLDTRISALKSKFRAPDPNSEEIMTDEDLEFNKRIVFQAQAEAIIEHIVANMEIKGIKTSGKADTTVKGETGPAITDEHVHKIELSCEDIEFTQNNDGIGHVQ